LTTDRTQDLFPGVTPVAPSPTLQTILETYVPLALSIGSEKARAELIVTPILAEVWKRSQPDIGFFSGVEFEVDEDQGLNGTCDYLFTRSREQSVITSPVLTIVEAKKEDLKPGMGQCIAEMVAARLFNEREGSDIRSIYGAVTTGTNWQFLLLERDTIFIDHNERFLNGVGAILGILFHTLGVVSHSPLT
jgi:hypothetical protein